MPKKLNSEGGVVPLLLLFAAIGLISFLLISDTFNFRDKLFSSLFPKPSSFAQTKVSPSASDQILVKFKNGLSDKQKQSVYKLYGLEKKDNLKQISVDLVKVNPKAKDRVLEALSKNNLIEYAEPDYLLKADDVPNDPWFSVEWHLKDINAPTAWDINKGSTAVSVAVIDSGVYSQHEDLAGQLTSNGYNFVDNNTDTADKTGHGTAVAGTMDAATNNGKGVASLGRNIMTMPLVAADSTGAMYLSNEIKAIDYAADNGAKTINISYGGSVFIQSEQDAVNYAWNKGLVIVAAAGNSNLSSIDYPAGDQNVIAVGAVDGSDNRANFSSYGTGLDVVAPGVGIYTTNTTNSYQADSGTSYSSPLVAALAGLIFSAAPNLAPQQVTDIITSTAKDLGDPGWDQYYGWGKIDAYAALQKATGITPLPDTTAPTVSITSPTSNSIISGIVSIAASASDNVAVTKVEFYIDNSLHTADSTSPYSDSWDTTTFANGTHTILAKAYDSAGNIGISSTTSVTVNNPVLDITPPTVSITSPVSGSTVSGSVNLTATASDNVSVSKVTYLIDGVYIGESTSSPYSVAWDTTQFSNGTHSLVANAIDPSNNLGTSAIVTVIVNNPLPSPTPVPTQTPVPTPTSTDTTVPTVSIIYPLNGSTVSKLSTVNIAASASDNIAVSKVEFYVNSSLTCTDTTSPYSCSWKVPGAKGKKYTVQAKAYDNSNNTSSSTITVTAN
ncbi:S8 family serine peptidase [Candidatus Daviesbacteria bacterium]|nr:S8 family serine peptidase [Candidatus Daviesbacteria bacterium]